MPPALAAAHTALDKAVDRCYRSEAFPTDRARVEHLFALYEKLTAPLAPTTVAPAQALEENCDKVGRQAASQRDA